MILEIALVGKKAMMSIVKNLRVKSIGKNLRFLPFALVGIAAFALNSNPDMHPYLQISIALFEAKLGILVVYLLSKKISKTNSQKCDNTSVN
jgi:hypothetical protein